MVGIRFGMLRSIGLSKNLLVGLAGMLLSTIPIPAWAGPPATEGAAAAGTNSSELTQSEIDNFFARLFLRQYPKLNSAVSGR
jgi:hypothetical protein